MAVASVVDKIPVTGLAFTCGRAWCLMVGAGAVVAHHAVSHDNETALAAFFVATQAGVNVVDETIAIHIREGRKIVWARVRNGQASPRNWRAIQQMVAVRKSTVMTNTAAYSAHFIMIHLHVSKAVYCMTIITLAEHSWMIVRHHMTLRTTANDIFVVYLHVNLPTGIVKMTAATVGAGLYMIGGQIHSVAIFTTP